MNATATPRSRRTRLHSTLLIAALSLSAPAVFAHPGHNVSGWMAGLSHPFGIDHLLAMVAVGLWSIVALPGRRALAGPARFVGAMLVGALAAIAGVRIPGVETGIAASLIALGALLFAAFRAQANLSLTNLGLSIITLSGLLHGMAHGSEAPLSTGFAEFVAGFIVTTACLHATGYGCGLALRRLGALPWRVAGVALSAVGLGLLVG